MLWARYPCMRVPPHHPPRLHAEVRTTGPPRAPEQLVTGPRRSERWVYGVGCLEALESTRTSPSCTSSLGTRCASCPEISREMTYRRERPPREGPPKERLPGEKEAHPGEERSRSRETRRTRCASSRVFFFFNLATGPRSEHGT